MAPTRALLPPVAGLFFEEEGHQYIWHDARLGKLRVPSMSAILAGTEAKAFNYGPWRGSLIRKGMSQAEADAFMEFVRVNRARVGTEVHALIRRELVEEPLPDGMIVSDEAEDIFEQWYDRIYPKIEEVFICEMPICHHSFFVAGTPDLLCRIGGRVTLLDWKTCQQELLEIVNGEWKLACPVRDPETYAHYLRGQRSLIDWSRYGIGAHKAKKRKEWVFAQGGYSLMIESLYGVKVDCGANHIAHASGVEEVCYNRADLEQAGQHFLGFLFEYHARMASLGDPIHSHAFRTMLPMFQ